MNLCVHVVLAFVAGGRYLMAGERSKPFTTVAASLTTINTYVIVCLELCVGQQSNVSLRV